MTHHFFNTSQQPFTQIRNGPPVKDLAMGFSSIGSANRLPSPGASSAAFAPYMANQNEPRSDNKTEKLDDSVLRSKSAEHEPLRLRGPFGFRQSKEFPTSSATSSTSVGDTHCSAASDSTSLDWLPMYKQAGKTDASKFPSLSLISGSNQRGKQVDDTQCIPGLDRNENPVPDKSKGHTESAAEILQRFGLEEDDLKELHSYPMDQITPQNLSYILQQIYIQKQKRATGKSSEAHPQLRSILKPSKVIDYGHSETKETSNDSRNQIGDSLQPDKVCTGALDSGKTSLIKPDDDLSERLLLKSSEKVTKLLPTKIPKSSPLNEPEEVHLMMSKNPKSCSQVSDVLNSRSDPKSSNKYYSKTEINQTVVNEEESKQLTNQKSTSEKKGLQTHMELGTHRGDEQVIKTPKDLKHQGFTAEASPSKPAEVQESFEEPLPTPSMIDDYRGIQPRKFPYRCSLCVTEIMNLADWHNHMAHKDHLKNSEIFKIKYPKWMGDKETLHRRKAKKLSLVGEGAQHHQQKNKPESHSNSNSRPGLDGRREESSSDSRSNDPVRHHGQRSHSNSHSPRSNQRSEKKHRCSRSRSRSRSPADSHQAKYTPESAAKILQIIGLEKEDLKELESYPEDQVTPENLHLILRQIYLKKKKAPTTENPSEPKPKMSVTLTNSLKTHETGLDKMPQSPLKSRKGIDQKHSANSNIVEDKLKQSSKESNEAGEDMLPPGNPCFSLGKKEKLHRPVERSKNHSINKPNGDLKNKLRKKHTKPLKAKHIASKKPHSGPMSATELIKEACLSNSDMEIAKKKSQGKGAIAAVKESNVLMEEIPKKKRMKKNNPLKCNVEGESKASKASPCIASKKQAPSKPAFVKGSFFSYLPTPAMIEDYTAATPRAFPHTFSRYNRESLYMQDWLRHQNSSVHLKNCGILQAQYPQSDGDVLPILNADGGSQSFNPHQYYGGAPPAGKMNGKPHKDKPTRGSCPWRGVRKRNMNNLRVLTG